MRAIGWILTLLLGVTAVVTLNPEWLGRLDADWAGLTTTSALAPVYALRPLLAAAFAVVAVITLVIAGIRKIGFRGGNRTLLLGLVLAAVAVGHGWMVVDRGLDNPGTLTADDGLRPAEPGTGALTVLAWNTLGGRSDAEDVAATAEANGVDVLMLPETSPALAEEIAAAMAGSGVPMQVFVQATGQTESSATALLVSTVLGEYVATEVAATSNGTVRAEPASGVGPVLVSVHAAAPLGEGHGDWLTDLDTFLALCADRGPSGLVLGGDLNATLDHRPLQDLGRCADAATAAGAGGVSTWPTRLPSWAGAAIDHVLVDGAWRVEQAAVVERGGSDHRGVLVRLLPAG